MICHINEHDLQQWRNFNALRIPDAGYKEKVYIDGIICRCVALEHPSMRSSNVRRRRYKDFSGHSAEIEMLKDAMYDLG